MANLKTLTQFKATEIQSPPKASADTKQPTYSYEQLAAITYLNGPSLVIAGPGAGKTHLLLGKLVYLLEHGVEADRILGVTFTRRAANEMRTRLEDLLPNLDKKPCIDTLHAFCWQIIKQHDPSAILLTDEQIQQIFAKANADQNKQIFAKANAYPSKTELNHILQHITKLREQCTLDLPTNATYKTLWTKYLQLAAKIFNCPCYDFTGILEHALELFQNHPPTYAALLVDEIQDCSQLNLNVIQSLLPKTGVGFFGIGDPNQSIYAFRGAVSSITTVLTNFYPTLKIFSLTKSYRASQKILDVAQKLIPKSNDHLLTAFRDIDAQLLFCQAPNENSEARWIVKNIAELIGIKSPSMPTEKAANPYAKELAASDIAILVRFKFQIKPIIQALAKVNIPCFAPSLDAFYNDEIIGKLLNLCDPLQELTADFPFERKHLPNPKDLGTWLDQQPWAGLKASASQAFKKLVQFFEQCKDWDTFWSELMWLKQEEQLKSKTQEVKILTLHAAKGLEFRACFLPGLEIGLMPANNTILNLRERLDENLTEELEAEEKRLFYVGLTRASQLLYLSAAKTRTIYGQQYNLPLSPFYSKIKTMFHESQIVQHTKNIQQQHNLLNI